MKKNNKNNVLLNSISANLIGIIGTVLGVVLFFISIYLYTNPIDKPNIENHVFETTKKCASYANGFHNSPYALTNNSIYEAKITGYIVYIKKEAISSGDNELLEIENIISNCKNMELVELCIGIIEENEDFKTAGCKSNGLNVTLKYKETWTYKPVF